MNTIKTLICYITMGMIIALITCTRFENNNPVDPQNTGGNYSLSVAKGQTAFSVLHKYSIRYSTGKDRFDSIIPVSGTDTLINTDIFYDSQDTAFLMLYFKRAFTGTIKFAGVRPNGLRMIDSIPNVTIVNPFTVECDTLLGIAETTYAHLLYNPELGTLAGIERDTVKWGVGGPASPGRNIRDSVVISSPVSGDVVIRPWVCGPYRDTIRLNETGVSFPAYRPVLDSFRITGGIWLGDTFSLVLSLRNRNSGNTTLITATSIGGQPPIINTIQITQSPEFLIPNVGIMRDTGLVACTVRVRDSFGLASAPVVSRPSPRIKYRLPAARFSLPDSTDAAINILKRFPIEDTAWSVGTRYFIRSSATQRTDTVTSLYHTITYATICRDTQTVTGQDRFGFTGKTDTLIVKVRNAKYSIKPVVYPGILQLKRDVVWRVRVVDDTSGTVGGSNTIEYRWSINPRSLLPFPVFNGDSARLRLSDSIAPFTLSVSAIINNSDTTTSLDSMIVVRAYRPQCSFQTDSIYGNAGDSVAITVKSTDTIGHGSVMNTYVQSIPVVTVTGMNRVLNGSDSVAKIFFPSGGTYTFRAWAIDNDGFASDTDTVYVSIGSLNPYFAEPFIFKTSFINDSVTLVAPKVNPGLGSSTVSITSYRWDIPVNGQIVSRTTIFDSTRIFLSDTSTRTIQISFTDSKGDTCRNPATLRITVLQGRPTLDSFSIVTDTAYINKSVRVRLVAHDTNGVIKRVVLDTSGVGHNTVTINGINAKAGILDTQVTFPRSGTYRMRAWVFDEDSIVSDTIWAPQSVYIDPGTPKVTAITVDSTAIYIKDRRTFTVAANHPNGTIARVAICWNGTLTSAADTNILISPGTATVNATIMRSYPDSVPGDSANVVVWVVGSDSLASPRAQKKFRINVGRPRVDSILTDSAYFIKDTCKYRIRSSDVNGSIKRVYISWTGSTTVPSESLLVARNTTGVFDTFFLHAFTDTSKVSQAITAWVKDDDSVQSPVLSRTVPVLIGRPVVNATLVDTARDSIFVRDVRRYSVTATDVNGVVKKVFAKWDDGTATVETLTVTTPARQVAVQFTHAYDTTKWGPHKVEFWAIDEDSVPCASRRIDSVFVHKAPPVLWGDSLDSIYVVVDSGIGRAYQVRVKHFDTNGTIMRYYWNEASADTGVNARKTSIDTIMRNVSAGDLVVPVGMWIYGKDDDGLMRGNRSGNRFVVVPDSAPPKPVMLNPPGGTVASLTLRWQNVDVRDGDRTEFQIMVGYGSGVQPTTVLKAYQPGSAYTKSGSEFQYVFTPAGNIFSIRIISRDARKTSTFSDVQSYSY